MNTQWSERYRLNTYINIYLPIDLKKCFMKALWNAWHFQCTLNVCVKQAWNTGYAIMATCYFMSRLLLYPCVLIRKSLRISDTYMIYISYIRHLYDIHINDIANIYLLIANILSKYIFRAISYYFLPI